MDSHRQVVLFANNKKLDVQVRQMKKDAATLVNEETSISAKEDASKLRHYTLNENQSVTLGKRYKNDVIIFNHRGNETSDVNVVKMKIRIPKNSVKKIAESIFEDMVRDSRNEIRKSCEFKRMIEDEVVEDSNEETSEFERPQTFGNDTVKDLKEEIGDASEFQSPFTFEDRTVEVSTGDIGNSSSKFQRPCVFEGRPVEDSSEEIGISCEFERRRIFGNDIDEGLKEEIDNSCKFQNPRIFEDSTVKDSNEEIGDSCTFRCSRIFHDHTVEDSSKEIGQFQRPLVLEDRPIEDSIEEVGNFCKFVRPRIVNDNSKEIHNCEPLKTNTIFYQKNSSDANQKKNDAEIIKQLVIERFANFFDDYERRRLNRKKKNVPVRTYEDVFFNSSGVEDSSCQNCEATEDRRRASCFEENQATEDASISSNSSSFKKWCRSSSCRKKTFFNNSSQKTFFNERSNYRRKNHERSNSWQKNPKAFFNEDFNSSLKNQKTFFNERQKNHESSNSSLLNKNSSYTNYEDPIKEKNDKIFDPKGNTIEASSTKTFNERNLEISTSTYTLRTDDAKCCASSTCSFNNLTLNRIRRLEDDFNFEREDVLHSPSSCFDCSNEDSITASCESHESLGTSLREELKKYELISELNHSANQSIGTSNISELLSKASSYSGTQQTSSVKTQRRSTTIHEENSYNSAENDGIKRKLSGLIVEINVQRQIIAQTKKAVGLCKRTKEFVSGIEEIEAERILLLATTKRDALREEMQRIQYEGRARFGGGSIIINGLSFPPKNHDKRKKEHSHWFVAIVRSDEVVFATKTVLPDEEGRVTFEGRFEFKNLEPDFRITVALYLMKVKDNAKGYSHESKYRLNKKVTSTMCPSPQKFFNLSKDNKPSSIPSKTTFAFQGRCDLNVDNLNTSGHFKLSTIAPSSTLEGTAVVNFSTSINIADGQSDFLDVGAEDAEVIAWTRRWCTLEGHVLMFFGHPEQDEPLGRLDLRCCLFLEVVDKKTCPKPRTLLLEVATEDGRKAVKVYLSADSVKTMKTWEIKINNTLDVLRSWKCAKFAKHV